MDLNSKFICATSVDRGIFSRFFSQAFLFGSVLFVNGKLDLFVRNIFGYFIKYVLMMKL